MSYLSNSIWICLIQSNRHIWDDAFFWTFIKQFWSENVRKVLDDRRWLSIKIDRHCCSFKNFPSQLECYLMGVGNETHQSAASTVHSLFIGKLILSEEFEKVFKEAGCLWSRRRLHQNKERLSFFAALLYTHHTFSNEEIILEGTINLWMISLLNKLNVNISKNRWKICRPWAGQIQKLLTCSKVQDCHHHPLPPPNCRYKCKEELLTEWHPWEVSPREEDFETDPWQNTTVLLKV